MRACSASNSGSRTAARRTTSSTCWRRSPRLRCTSSMISRWLRTSRSSVERGARRPRRPGVERSAGLGLERRQLRLEVRDLGVGRRAAARPAGSARRRAAPGACAAACARPAPSRARSTATRGRTRAPRAAGCAPPARAARPRPPRRAASPRPPTTSSSRARPGSAAPPPGGGCRSPRCRGGPGSGGPPPARSSRSRTSASASRRRASSVPTWSCARWTGFDSSCMRWYSFQSRISSTASR